MNYSEIITKAARIIWKYKVLWLFGLLAGCAGGGSRGFSLNFNYTLGAGDFTSSGVNLPEPLYQLALHLSEVIRQAPVWFFLALFTIVCGVGIIAWLIGVFGRTGLTRGAWLADGDEQPLGFGRIVNEGMQAYWRVAGITLLIGLPGLALTVIFLAFGITAFVSSFTSRVPQVSILLLCTIIPLVCLLVPIFWFLGIWSELATVAAVGENRGVIDSLKRSWQLLRRHLGPALLMGILVLIAQVAFGFLIGLMAAPLGFGAIFTALLLNDSPELMLGLMIPLAILVTLIALALGAVFQSYVGTLWTLVFRRLAVADATPAPYAPTPPVPPIPPAPLDFPPAVPPANL